MGLALVGVLQVGIDLAWRERLLLLHKAVDLLLLVVHGPFGLLERFHSFREVTLQCLGLVGLLSEARRLFFQVSPLVFQLVDLVGHHTRLAVNVRAVLTVGKPLLEGTMGAPLLIELFLATHQIGRQRFEPLFRLCQCLLCQALVLFRQELVGQQLALSVGVVPIVYPSHLSLEIVALHDAFKVLFAHLFLFCVMLFILQFNHERKPLSVLVALALLVV